MKTRFPLDYKRVQPFNHRLSYLNRKKDSIQQRYCSFRASEHVQIKRRISLYYTAPLVYFLWSLPHFALPFIQEGNSRERSRLCGSVLHRYKLSPGQPRQDILETCRKYKYKENGVLSVAKIMVSDMSTAMKSNPFADSLVVNQKTKVVKVLRLAVEDFL